MTLKDDPTDGLLILHWVADTNRWDRVAGSEWATFLGVDRLFGKRPARGGLSNVQAGVHHFVVVCLDDDGVTPVNIIPHKYLIERGGFKGPDNFAGFSREDNRDYLDLHVKRILSAKDDARLNELRRRVWMSNLPPTGSVPALVRALPRPPERGSAAERFLLTEMFAA